MLNTHVMFGCFVCAHLLAIMYKYKNYTCRIYIAFPYIALCIYSNSFERRSEYRRRVMKKKPGCPLTSFFSLSLSASTFSYVNMMRQKKRKKQALDVATVHLEILKYSMCMLLFLRG